MDERNPRILFFGVVSILLLIALFWMFSTNRIGLFSQQLEAAARNNQQLDASWQVVKGEDHDTSALFFFSEETNAYTYAIYHNPPGLSFGYFFAGSGKGTYMGNVVAVSSSAEGNTVMLYSQNALRIATIGFTNKDEAQEIAVDPAQPFVVVLPASADFDSITLADENGQAVSF